MKVISEGVDHVVEINKMIINLEYGAAYTITFMDSDDQESRFDMWLDKENTAYCLQKIYMLVGIPDEIGDTITYSKTDITKKLIELSSYNQIRFREWY